MSKENKTYELVNFCEFDKYAAQSYCAIHNVDESLNLGDILEVDETKLKDFNWIVGGSPCQSFSVAGKQEGAKWICNDCKEEYNPLKVHYTKRDCCPKCGSKNIDKKTTSSLIVEYLRIIQANKPNVITFENVKNLVGKKFKETFDLFYNELNEYGYNCYYKVLNAKDYGIPQNRERVYLIGIKKELDNGKFEFPQGFDNGIRLKDFLDDEVDEKYYLSGDMISKLVINDNGLIKTETNRCLQVADLNHYNFEDMNRVYSEDGLCPTIRTMQGGNRQPKIITHQEWKEEMFEKYIADSGNEVSGVYTNQSKSFGYRPPMLGFSKCLKANANDAGVVSNKRVRKLTPKECFRLMGFSDNDFEKAKYYLEEEISKLNLRSKKKYIDLPLTEKIERVSDSQLYKQSGNSIVVDVLYYIYIELYKVMPYLFDNLKVSSFFSGIGAFEVALDRLYQGIDNGNFTQP